MMLRQPQRRDLSELTTMRVGGPAMVYTADTTESLAEIVADADRSDTPLLVLGGGSNLVVGDDGFDGVVAQIALRGMAVDDEDGAVVLDVAAGENWDELVAFTVAEGLSGLECLSGIPGLVGATPIQNVGAYGSEVAEVIRAVDVWDRQSFDVAALPAAFCEFGYRSSLFKRAGRHVVLGVRFGLRRSPLSAPIRYAELARTLGVDVGERAPLAQVREAVLSLRASKGMVLNPSDHDTWSAGSFFTNPFVAPAGLPEGAPSWPAEGGLVKTSAAWLIEHAGFAKGYGTDRASLSTKHTLALTNRGTATAADIVALAGEIRDGVQAAFGVQLHPEARLINCTLG